MRISEVLISILIFCLTSICFLQVLPFFSKEEEKTKTGIKDSILILENDEKIRNEIRKIEIPYWKNTDNVYQSYILGIKNNLTLEGAEILSVEALKNKGRVEGLKVLWIYKNKKIETEERFSSRTVF